MQRVPAGNAQCGAADSTVIYAPMPGATPRWMYEILVGILIVLIVTAIGSIALVRLNHRLRKTQKVLQERENLLHVAMRSARQAWFEADVRTGEKLVSPEYHKILGYEKGEYTPSLNIWLSSIHPDDLVEMRRIYETLLQNGGPESMTYRRLNKAGEWLWFHSTATVIEREEDGKAKLITGIHMDITEDMRQQEELQHAKEAADEANRAKSRFLATMSHEIRTPMNGILGMAQLLMLPQTSEENRNKYVHIIYDSGKALLNLLNDILDLSKIEAERIEIEQIDFEPERLVRNVGTLFETSAGEKGVALDVAWHGGDGVRYRADATRLHQMISNFVSNAVKFTKEGTIRIEGRESTAENGGPMLEFSVTDTGIGIPADKQALLFQPFTQVDTSTTRRFGGTGLGLSIVRKLALKMGGDVGVESEEHKGSRFWFRIVAERIQDGTAQEEPSVTEVKPDGPGRPEALNDELILVVEDIEYNRIVIGAILTQMGYRYETALNGREAVDRITGGESMPDLILMDCQMPVMDGCHATETIRAWEAKAYKPRIPVIAMTAGAFEEDRRRSFAAGMDDFLTKPVDINVLKTMLDKWLEKA